MGADWVQLFDKRLCDKIVGLPPEEMPSFLQSHFSLFDQFSEFQYGFEKDVPTTIRLNRLRREGRTDGELKAELVDSLCVRPERITVDYWGCYVEVFKGCDPDGSVPDRKIFPHLNEPGYLLLRPEHVDRMLSSLDKHRDELLVMGETEISRLRQWREQCVEDPSYMVAYFYDY